MDSIESRLNNIAEHLIAGTIINTATNIRDGKAGVAVYLYYCGQALQNEKYTNVADGIISELEELLPNQIIAGNPDALETGIIFEYLIQHQFIEDNEETMIELDKCFWEHFFPTEMDSRGVNPMLDYYAVRTRKYLKYPLSRSFIDNLIRLEDLLVCLEKKEMDARESMSYLYILMSLYHSPVKEFLETIDWEKHIGTLLKNMLHAGNDLFTQPLERSKFLILLPLLQKIGLHGDIINQLSAISKGVWNAPTTHDLSTGTAGLLLEKIISGKTGSETLSGLLANYPENFAGYYLPSQEIARQLGIREGIAGIGLALLAYSHRQHLKWIKLLF